MSDLLPGQVFYFLHFFFTFKLGESNWWLKFLPSVQQINTYIHTHAKTSTHFSINNNHALDKPHRLYFHCTKLFQTFLRAALEHIFPGICLYKESNNAWEETDICKYISSNLGAPWGGTHFVTKRNSYFYFHYKNHNPISKSHPIHNKCSFNEILTGKAQHFLELWAPSGQLKIINNKWEAATTITSESQRDICVGEATHLDLVEQSWFMEAFRAHFGFQRLKEQSQRKLSNTHSCSSR